MMSMQIVVIDAGKQVTLTPSQLLREIVLGTRLGIKLRDTYLRYLQMIEGKQLSLNELVEILSEIYDVKTADTVSTGLENERHPSPVLESITT